MYVCMCLESMCPSGLDKDYDELLEKISAKQKQLRMAQEQLVGPASACITIGQYDYLESWVEIDSLQIFWTQNQSLCYAQFHRSMILIPSRVQADVEEQEKEKAEDLKELESKLVSVLMEQQKRMLSVVGSVASASSSLKAVGKFNKKRLKDVWFRSLS